MNVIRKTLRVKSYSHYKTISACHTKYDSGCNDPSGTLGGTQAARTPCTGLPTLILSFVLTVALGLLHSLHAGSEDLHS